MEEFYRRKYLSPSYTRTASYVDTLEKDKTVAELRKELQDCKEMEEKFDDLCLEIVKLERENKKLESDQSQVEGEYMQKVKVNKARITELKQAILDHREQQEAHVARIAALQTDNQRLLQELKRIKQEAEQNITQKELIYQKLQSQEALIADIKAKVEQGKAVAAQTRKENQLKSQQLERSYQSLKKSELKLKEDELSSEETRQQLQQLVTARQQWVRKTEISRLKLEAAKKQCQAQQSETTKLEVKLREAQVVKQKENAGVEAAEKELKSCVTRSKEGCLKVKNYQAILLETFKNLQNDQIYLEKMAVKEAESKKGNERLEEILASLQEILSEQQESYNRIIGHMKFSIQQDEKAIQSLSKQASLLEQMSG